MKTINVQDDGFLPKNSCFLGHKDSMKCLKCEHCEQAHTTLGQPKKIFCDEGKEKNGKEKEKR